MPIVFYIASYAFLIDVLKRYPISSFEVISGHKAIAATCRRLGIPVTYVERNTDLSFSGWYRYRKTLREMADGWKNRNIGFGFYLNSIPDLYLIEQLSKHNNTWFLNTDPLLEQAGLPDWQQPRYRHELKAALIWRWVFGLPVRLFRIGEIYIPGISPVKLENRFPAPPIPERSSSVWEENRRGVLSAFGQHPFDIVYIDNIAGFHPDKLDAVHTLLRSLNDRGYSVGIKPHPLQPLPEKLIRDFNQIDPGLPAEFLGSVTRNAVIGVSSLALNTLSEQVPTYSLIHCLPFDMTWAETVERRLFHGNIQLPKSLEEFSVLFPGPAS